MGLFDVEPIEMLINRISEPQLLSITQLHDADGRKQFADTTNTVESIGIGQSL